MHLLLNYYLTGDLFPSCTV